MFLTVCRAMLCSESHVVILTGNMEILTKAEPEDSDTPPTPPPHDEQLDTSSPASSECSDEELPYDDDSNGDETTESETLDTVAR